MPNSELVRTVTYLAGFTLGLAAVGAAIYVIIMDPEQTALFGTLVALGLALMGGNAVATYNVPSVKPQHPETKIDPVSAVVADSNLLERAQTGSIESIPVDPIEMTQNADSPRRGEPGVVYKPDSYPDFPGHSLPNSGLPGKYGKHE